MELEAESGRLEAEITRLRGSRSNETDVERSNWSSPYNGARSNRQDRLELEQIRRDALFYMEEFEREKVESQPRSSP